MIYDECMTEIGRLRLILKEDGTLQRILLNDVLWSSFLGDKTVKQSTELGGPIRRQLQEYFYGDRREFDLPVELNGTPFQQQAWQALREIPYGETRSYSEMASSIGRPKAVRAVGHANAVNPIPIIFPCHRVIGKDRSLTGYAGGMDMKKQLLQMEGVVV
ncbi:MAG TPA: methylated-DNA--[protein]-cysteine S-methyltransferase [Bacillales bacterium]|nr:methylated-DNA--[protein]-cysteine S-methyltransferase [Bacillales bacterium]